MKTHPYKELESNWLWKIVNKSIEDLINNQDIKEKTSRTYIVGYICRSIYKSREFRELKKHN